MTYAGNLPRRLCIEPSSPHFSPLYRKIGVKVNGTEIFNCAEYDIDGRWVRRTIRCARNGWKRERGRLVTVTQRDVLVEPFMKTIGVSNDY